MRRFLPLAVAFSMMAIAAEDHSDGGSSSEAQASAAAVSQTVSAADDPRGGHTPGSDADPLDS